MSDDILSEAVTCSIRHIGLGITSSGKIKSYLENAGFNEEIIDKAIDELILRGYVDDKRFSHKIIKSRTNKKQESKNLLYKRLLSSGINKDIASLVIDSLPEDNETMHLLIKACGFELDSLTPSSKETLLKLLIRRGYSIDTISDILSED